MHKEFAEIVTGIRRGVALLQKREKQQLLLALLIMLVAGVLTNLPAVILGRLVDSLGTTQRITLTQVLPYIAFIIVVIILRELLTIARKYIVENIATQLDKEQTVRVIERLLKTDIKEFLYQHQIGSLHGKVFRSMQGLIRLIKLSFLDFAPIFFSALAAVSIALLQKPLIASVMILVVPAGLFLIVKQVSSQKGIRVSLLRGKEEIDGKVVELLSGIESIRVANTVATEVNKVEKVAEKLRTIEIRHHIYMSLFDAAKYLNEGFFYILVICLAVVFSAQGLISKGDILVYAILYLSITSPLREIHRILDEAHESSIRVHDLYSLINQPLDTSFIATPENSITQKTSALIQVKKLSFSYTGQEKLLKNISLQINRGEKIGIAGASGCGKSTFIHLLLRLSHGYTGDLHLFGKELTSLSREEIAKRISYVSQKPFIFSGTIKDNVVYGSSRDVSEEEVIQATKGAQIYDEIMHKLGGFSGKVSESGNNLSGGQRQRLALARIFLSNAELFIFDEATSALDNTNEAKIQACIEDKFREKTIITIAHRLTTLKNCDRILVFANGTIAQEGTYQKLFQTPGLFQDFLKQRVAR